MKTFKRVQVEWQDACSHDEWQTPEHLDDSPLNCVTVGFLCKETKTDIYVAGTMQIGEDDDVSCVMQIPKGMVKKITKI